MSESYGFFNSATNDIRQYDSADYSELFSNFFKTGVANTENGIGLKVVVNSGLNYYVQSGYAIIQGHYYKNTSNISLALDVASATVNRIDRIVLRLDLVARTIKVLVKKGILAVTPVVPALQRDTNVYEISLAQIRINKNTTTGIVTDERLNTTVCGLVSVAASIPDQEMWNQFNTDWTNIKKQWDIWYNNVYNNIGSKTFISANIPTNPVINDIWIDI